MADRYVFAGEAGNFDFSRGTGASRYFILCTVDSRDCEVGDALLALRRQLGWRGLHLDRVFHATEDPQTVRDEVFALLAHMGAPFGRGRCRQAALAMSFPPGGLLASGQRPVPPGRRLLHVGDPAQVGEARPTITCADRTQAAKRVRRLGARESPVLLRTTVGPRKASSSVGAEPRGSFAVREPTKTSSVKRSHLGT